MSLSDLFAKATAVLFAKQQAIDHDFEALAIAIADGKVTDGTEIAKGAERTGRSLAALESRVQTIQRRRTLKAKLDTGPRITAELDQVQAAIDKATAAWEAAQREYHKAMQPLAAKQSALELQREELRRVEAELRDLADTDQHEQVQARREEAQPIRQQIGRLKDQIRRLRQDCEQHNFRLSGQTWGHLPVASPDDQERARQQLQRIEAQIARLEGELAPLEAQLREAEKAEQEAASRLLTTV
jgi:chromosome segregation ATPase